MNQILSLIATMIFASNVATNSGACAGQMKTTRYMKGSSSDASLIGFRISEEWEYVDSVEKDQIELNGARYFFGYMDSWMGIYKCKDESNNNMYVLLLSSIESKPTSKSYWDQYRWNNRDMKAVFKAADSSIHYLAYAPESTGGEITTSTSLQVGAQYNGQEWEPTVSVVVSESYKTSDVTIQASGETENEIGVNYHFVRYNKNKELHNICCSNVKGLSYSIFKIDNYSSSNEYSFSVTNYVSMYRIGKFNNGEVTEHQEQTFKI